LSARRRGFAGQTITFIRTKNTRKNEGGFGASGVTREKCLVLSAAQDLEITLYFFLLVLRMAFGKIVQCGQ